MSLSDKLLAGFVVLWLILTATFFLIGLQVWGWLWVGILLSVVVAEAVSWFRFSRTLTQRFGEWATTHRGQALLLLTGMAVAWGLLLAHLVL